MARAYRVPQKMRTCRSDSGTHVVITETKPNYDNEFNIGDPVLLNNYACNFIAKYYCLDSKLFKHAIVAQECQCPPNYITIEFLNVVLPDPTNVDKTLIKKLIKK